MAMHEPTTTANTTLNVTTTPNATTTATANANANATTTTNPTTTSITVTATATATATITFGGAKHEPTTTSTATAIATAATTRPLRIITGADSFGSSLKDTLVGQLRSLNIEVEDLGTSKYYTVGEEVGRRVSQAYAAEDSTIETRGLVACGTGVGVAIFANKFPGVYAATCLTPDEALNARSINNCNVLAVSGMFTSPETASEILAAFLNTTFKSPCPASGSDPWPDEIQSFLDASINEMSQIGRKNTSAADPPCFICSLGRSREDKEFTPMDVMPGGSMKLLRETPTSAIVRFKAGSVEPAHHHSFGHDLVVIEGSKSVWNLSKGEKYDLGIGDYLFTPAGDVHRVKYYEDTEFFIKWDGHWDFFLDEDVAAGNAAVDDEEKK